MESIDTVNLSTGDLGCHETEPGEQDTHLLSLFMLYHTLTVDESGSSIFTT